MPIANGNLGQALRFRLYDFDLRSCACVMLDDLFITIFRINVAQYIIEFHELKN